MSRPPPLAAAVIALAEELDPGAAGGTRNE